jgi:hypothetical protein
LKLAAIYTAASTGALKVTPQAWNMAVERARHLEETIFTFLPTGMNSGGYERAKMLNRIQDEGDDGITLSAFTRAFQHTENWQRENHLSTLSDSGQVLLFTRKTTGGPSAVLVAENCVSGYREKYPLDSQAVEGIKTILRRG